MYTEEKEKKDLTGGNIMKDFNYSNKKHGTRKFNSFTIF